jgi:putative DNA primase/helicase
LNFFQQLTGYLLTGLTYEQQFYFLHGTGANGKSVVLGILLKLLGDYGVQTMPEVLMAQSSANATGATPHLVRLAGARGVFANETGEGQRLDEALIKQLTGGDPIVARPLYGKPFEFIPAFKLLFAGNYKPIIRGDDHGIWRRIVLIPFNRRFAESEQDKELSEKLSEELPGILNWAIAGALSWRRNRLRIPSAIKAEGEQYKSDMDLIEQWLDEECIKCPEKTFQASLAYSSFSLYCTSSGLKAISKNRFSEKLKSRGIYSKKGTKGVRSYSGIGPRATSLNSSELSHINSRTAL